MATNIEQIFRDFVMNKIKEIADETEENSVTDEPQPEPVTETREDGLEEEKMNTPTDEVTHTDLQDNHDKEDTSTKHRKSKKHKKHKSKKKKKKRKEGKDSSSGTESDKETQESGKKKKRKKKKKSKDADKVKRSGSRSESSSASGSESETKPSSENTKSSSAGQTSKSELKVSSGVGKPRELPDIIPKTENSVHKSTENERPKEKKRSSSRTSKSKESSRGRRSRSRSPKRQRRSKSTSRSRNSSKKRSHQRRERSRSRSKRRNSRSRSRSVRRGERSRSRRTRSRSVVILKRNRRSTSKSGSRSPRHRCRSRSKSRSRTKPSKSRSVSKSRSELKPETESDPVDKTESSEMQTDVSQDTTENRKSPTVAVNSDTKPSETASDISNPGFNAVGFKGSWRPVPFLAELSKSSQKCITPEVPLEVTDVSEEPSTFSTAAPKDSQCADNPETKESNPNPTLTSAETNSASPSKSPSHKISSRSKPGSKSPSKKRKSRSSSRKSRSPSERKSHKSRTRSKRSKSRSPKKKRSRSRSHGRRRKSRTPDRSRRSKSRKRSRSCSRRRSRSGSRWRRGFGSRSLNQRDRWKREPSRSPVLILRKKRSASRTQRSSSKTPPRLTELDKGQLLEIAKANAAAMCAKAGVPIPESLRPRSIFQLPLQTPNPTSLSLALPVMSSMTMNAAMASMTAATMTAALSSMGALASLPQLAPLPTIVNKPPSSATPNLASIEEAKKKVTKQANSFSIKELTERCKKIAESKEEMAIAKPHVSDDEEDEKLSGASLKENKGIAFSLGSSSIKPAVRTEAVFAKEFPVSSGSQHRKKEADGAYGEWVPVEKKIEKPSASSSSGTEEASKDNDSVFPEAPSQPVDITLAVSERAVAQKRLAENPFDISAMCMLNRAQEQVDAWAQSNTIPGLFTGSTGAQVLSSDELSNSGPQAWIKKGQSL
uniref:Protein SON-like n=1 Tax=Sinocyclocheilus grahami TaxID=75366 RepID=A0A672T0E8_SINGR